MEKVRTFIKRVTLKIWQILQLIIGYIFLIFHRGSITKKIRRDIRPYNTVTIYYSKKMNGGISLGPIVVLNSKHNNRYSHVTDHEVGHSHQSMWLGPLYLLVIGIPSIAWAGIRRLGFFKKKSYYSFYTERWANTIMGIKQY